MMTRHAFLYGSLAMVTTPLAAEAQQAAPILATAAELRLPTMFQTAEYVRAGGLLAYVPSVSDQAKRAVSYVVKILNGAKPGDRRLGS